MMGMTAHGWVVRLRQNVDDYYDGKITYESFCKLQRAAWDRIIADGMGKYVTDALRTQ
jgi:hypothetical protein